MIPGRPPENMSEDEDSALNISSSIVSYIIERAREAYADMPADAELDEEEDEHRAYEADLSELAQFIDDLNEDEQFDLVVLMWIGRGTYTTEELEQARADARREATHAPSEYLLSTPLVGDYLADGLEAFDMPIEQG